MVLLAATDLTRGDWPRYAGSGTALLDYPRLALRATARATACYDMPHLVRLGAARRTWCDLVRLGEQSRTAEKDLAPMIIHF